MDDGKQGLALQRFQKTYSHYGYLRPKRFGKLVHEFDDTIWHEHVYVIVLEGNTAKVNMIFI